MQKNLFKLSWLFGLDGRINRYQLLVGQVVSIVFLVTTSLLASSFNETIRPLILAVIFLSVFAVTLFIFVKRYHDIDRSGWYFLLGFVPVVNLYFGIYLIYCVKGSVGANRFGQPPDA